jgi:hypothetical protein
MIRLAALLLALSAPAAATVQPYMGAYPDTVAGIEYANLSGVYCIAASSKTPTSCLVVMDGRYGWVRGSSAAWTYGMSAATGTFTGTGNGVYDLTLSSGMLVSAGGVTAPWFNGALYGSAAGLSLPSGNLVGMLSSSIIPSTYVATTNTYADPAWVTSLAGAKITGAVANATTAANLAAGGAGQHPYQSAAGTTLFLPSMGAAGIIVGNGSGVAPSTAVLQGTANQITVTQSATAITLATPQNINSGAAPTFTGTNLTGIPESGVTNLTTDLAAKAATFTGISSSCASGFHLSTTTVSNGILTGGSCVADGAGGGGLSSITITSVTASGGSIISLYGPGISTPGFALDGAGLTLSSSGVIGVKNLTFVASTETYPSGTLAASSSAGPCFSASTATWTQGNNKALFCFSGSAIQSAGGFAALSFLIDGQFPDGLTATKGVPLQTSGATGSAVSFCWLTKNALSAGAHNACLTGLTNGNTLTIPNATTLNTLAQFSVQELATGGAGYSAPSSSFTVVAPGAYTNTTFAAAITTVTLTVNGGVMDIWGMGSWSSSSNGMALGVLVDGMYISTTSGQTAYGQSTVFGTVSEDKNMGAVNGVPAAFGYATNLSFPPIRVSGLSSGSHSVALTLKTDGTMTLPPANYPQVKYYFGASEVRNSAGTGDVSSNGTNTFSGSNTFTGPISGVSQSSWTALTWTSLPAAINSNTLFNVGIATIAFTAHQSGPIKCWVSAGIANGNSGTCDVGWSVLVDGVNIDGHPVTIPVMKAGATGSNVSVNQFATAYTSTNTYTAGLHNFVMTMASNNCNINATALAAPSANVGSPQFGCSTVP